MGKESLRSRLDKLVEKYNRPEFIGPDPISIPHRFSKKQDIEIAGLFSATLAWGQRTTILKNLNALMDLMDQSPHAFIVGHVPKERKRFEKFVHRTFNFEDLLYFIEFLQHHYAGSDTLEDIFASSLKPNTPHVGDGLMAFHQRFFSLPHLSRTEKHISSPSKKSACKRMNLFLRWMVRYDNKKVDFGIWKNIQPKQLLCPLDVHVHRVALELGLMQRSQADWTATLELTNALRKLDPIDPVRYDFALFGLGIENKL